MKIEQTETSARACIIGAGASGMTTAKTLQEHGIAFDCFEKGSHIGGNWRYLNDNGQSAAYHSLHINSSKGRSCFSDFPMPDDYPEYPNHKQISAYFESYVNHFKFRDKIIFNTEVQDVRPSADGAWQVELAGGEKRNYRAVLVANGHHWDPRWPDFSGTFSGETLHAHAYKTPEMFRDRNVLIVGIGNSAVDIACDVCRVACKTVVSTRRSAYILPKYAFGKPIDQFTTATASYLPLPLQRGLFRMLAFFARGSQKSYGVPVPTHRFGSEHPTVSSDFLLRVGHGDIAIKPDIERFDDEDVHFIDHTSGRFDVIIYATGYKISFPFLDPEILSVQNNELNLYHNVVHPERPNLYFMGFLQPLGAIMPLAEWQAKWVAGLLSGAYTLPDRAVMQHHIAKTRRQMRRRYFDSPRHTIQVDFFPYIRALRKEMRTNKNRH